jgi:hypothetical protein
MRALKEMDTKKNWAYMKGDEDPSKNENQLFFVLCIHVITKTGFFEKSVFGPIKTVFDLPIKWQIKPGTNRKMSSSNLRVIN